MSRIIVRQITQNATQPGSGGPTLLWDSHGKKYNVDLELFNGAVTLFIAYDYYELSQLDAVGNPIRGFVLAANVIKSWLNFRGKIWGACNQQVEVEVTGWLAE